MRFRKVAVVLCAVLLALAARGSRRVRTEGPAGRHG